jgi:hypothetical protein
MSAWATVRDVLALDPNPAKLSVPEIAKRLGICKSAASDLRALACRSPAYERMQMERLLGVQGRAP